MSIGGIEESGMWRCRLIYFVFCCGSRNDDIRWVLEKVAGVKPKGLGTVRYLLWGKEVGRGGEAILKWD